MSTAQTVKTQLQNLINVANATTGNNDADLTTAINTLVAGYGTAGDGEDTGTEGGEIITKKTLCTLSEDATFKTILTNYPITLSYSSEVLIIRHIGDNAPSQGDYTVNTFVFFIVGGNNAGLGARWQQNGLVAPSAVASASGGVYQEAISYYTVVDGVFGASNITNDTRYFAAGNTIEYIEIPINIATLESSGD